MATELDAPLPRFEIRRLTAEEGGGYLVEFPDYPGCMSDGETQEEAMREGVAVATWMAARGGLC